MEGVQGAKSDCKCEGIMKKSKTRILLFKLNIRAEFLKASVPPQRLLMILLNRSSEVSQIGLNYCLYFFLLRVCILVYSCFHHLIFYLIAEPHLIRVLGKHVNVHGGAGVLELVQDSRLISHSPLYFPPPRPDLQLFGFLLIFSLLELIPQLKIRNVSFEHLSTFLGHLFELHGLLPLRSLSSKSRSS